MIKNQKKDEFNLIKNYPNTLENPSQNENNFMYFLAFDKKWYNLQFNELKGIVKSKIKLKSGISRKAVNTNGFRVKSIKNLIYRLFKHLLQIEYF